MLLGAYQGASQPVFQPAYMGHPVAYSGLSGQTRVVGSDYCTGIPSIAGVPISALMVTSVSSRASTRADVHLQDYSAPARSETTDTHLQVYSMRPRSSVRTPTKTRGYTSASSTTLTLRRLEVTPPVRPVSYGVPAMAGSCILPSIDDRGIVMCPVRR